MADQPQDYTIELKMYGRWQRLKDDKPYGWAFGV
jgi:hypothetical protein